MPYIGTSPSNGVRQTYDYTATAGQTSFSGTDNNSQTLVYQDSAYIDVYQNGILLVPSDYTATTGTTVVLDTGATVSDTLQIVVYDVFSVADTVSASDGGSFGGNVGVGGTLAVTGIATFTDDIIIGDGKTIGSASDIDAMTISSGGVVDFSVPPTGTGMTRLLTTTTTSAAANVTISNTYINSTFDTYFIMFNLRPATDNVNMLIRYAVDGSTFITDSHYGWASYALDTNTGAYSSNSDTSWRISATPIGNSTGEGIHGYLYVVGANNTAFPSGIVGILNGYNNGSNHVAASFGGGQEVDADARSQVINGLQFLTSSGNIASSEITVYGLDKS